jgi:signal transduction histidine kinase
VNALPDLIGLGLYSIPEAARLVEVAPARVRGWEQGYRDGTSKPQRPALVGHVLPDVEGKTALSFRELVEVRFIRQFLRAGVSWRNIRHAAAQARRDLLSEAGHRLRFSTDGVKIFANTRARGGDRRALDLVAHQYVMLHVLARSIRSEFDLEAEDVIRAWHPRPEMPLVLLDPRRSFGHPIVEPGVPTRICRRTRPHARLALAQGWAPAEVLPRT